MDTLEVATPYYKGSQKTTPPKADHKHEYIIVSAWNYIRRFDGSISDRKYKISLPPTCVDCGHENLKARRSATEVEVTPKEYRELRDKRKK